MATLVHTHRHVWLAQLPHMEARRRVLQQLPAEPGKLFGSATQTAQDHGAKADITSRQLAALQRASMGRTNGGWRLVDVLPCATWTPCDSKAAPCTPLGSLPL